MKGKKIFRCMPVLVALCVLLEGMFFMAVTKPGHVPDIWTHVYRIDSILNGDVIARPVTSRSMLHNTETGVVGGAVDRSWMQYSLDQYDGYDPGIVIAESVADNGSSTTVDLLTTRQQILRSYMLHNYWASESDEFLISVLE